MGPLDRLPGRLPASLGGRDRVPGARRGPAVGLALLAGLAVYATSIVVFPHHSINHDEAVYLQQAEMLLAGRLNLYPPVEDVFRPWFFVADGGRLYPRYAPVPAGVFAIGALVGDVRLALAAVGAGVCYLTVAVTTEAFDRRTGLLAGALLLASPLFLVDAAVFLPYATATLLNLTFALGYLRADRTGSRRWAGIAGIAIGLAFFARPYTAVLFTAPFAVHALWSIRRLDGPVLGRQLLVAAGGAAGVVVALGYNALLTGSPLLFPYEAFAPRDGLGFGRRAILGYERAYTPEVALRANAEVLWRYLTRWVVAGPLGATLAGAGLAGCLVRAARRPGASRGPGRAAGRDPDGRFARRAVLAGLFVSVTAGNVLFWGNLNLLGHLGEGGGGLVRYLGPYYHFDLLAPTAAFGATGALALADTARAELRARLSRRRAASLGLAALIVSGSTFAGVAGAALAGPLADNRENTRQLAVAYEPVDDGGPDDAVVFLPTPLGDWLNHPFQRLRNDPGFDGPTVYAIDERPFAVADAYPDRQLYRYVYRGSWAPVAGQPVDARLRPVHRARGERVALSTAFGLPAGVDASVRLAAGDDHAYYAVRDAQRILETDLVVGNGSARLRGANLVALDPGNATVRPEARDEVTVTVFADRGRGSGFSYRVGLPVALEGGHVRALSPRLEVCRDPRRCGGEAAYVPAAARPGVFVRASLTGREAPK